MKDKVKLKYKAIETRASGCLCPCNAGSCNGSSQMSWGYRGKSVRKGTKYSWLYQPAYANISFFINKTGETKHMTDS